MKGGDNLDWVEKAKQFRNDVVHSRAKIKLELSKDSMTKVLDYVIAVGEIRIANPTLTAEQADHLADQSTHVNDLFAEAADEVMADIVEGLAVSFSAQEEER